ncbi:MAG: mannose-1-phosphate guanylyltransferase/mannose-6-phosphate isomerase [Pseudomonadota bacterium]
MIDAARIHPAVMSGGSGTRLWPLSRAEKPKQFHALVGEETMLDATLARLAPFAPPLLIAAAAHEAHLVAALPEAGPASIVLEPFGRNTAAAAAVAAALVAERDADGLVLLAPADHHISDPASFQQTVLSAAAAADDGRIVTFGVRPTHPATGYGYIRRGVALDVGGADEVAAFVEKPNRDKAKAYLQDGAYLWNAGIFLFRARTMLDELKRWRPDIHGGALRALHAARRDGPFVRLPEAEFADCPSESVDYAVMEKTDCAAVAPAAFPWTDLGAWDAVLDIADCDGNGVSAIGDVVAIGGRNALLRSDGPLVAAIGVEDMVVVATEDAIFVAPTSRVQEVKEVVSILKEKGRTEAVRFLARGAAEGEA